MLSFEKSLKQEIYFFSTRLSVTEVNAEIPSAISLCWCPVVEDVSQGLAGRKGYSKLVFSFLGHYWNNNIKITKWKKKTKSKSSSSLFKDITPLLFGFLFRGHLSAGTCNPWEAKMCCVGHAAIPSCRPWACSTDTTVCWFLMFAFALLLALQTLSVHLCSLISASLC